jgi:replicative DNA helicase
MGGVNPYADLVIPDPVDPWEHVRSAQPEVVGRPVAALHVSHLVAQAVAETAVRHEHGSIGLRTSLETLNPHLGEMLTPGTVTVVAGSSGVAKTTLLSQLAVEFAEGGAPVMLASMEDDGPDVVKRMLANVGNGNVGQIRAGFRDPAGRQQPIPAEFDAAAERLSALPLTVITQQVSITELAAEVARWRATGAGAECPLGVVIVDQLGHLLPDDPAAFKARFPHAQQPPRIGAREDRIWEWQVAALKALAEHFRVVVIVAHQLNEVRDDAGKPTLGSIRDSRGIVHKAHAVLAVWRPTRLPNPDAGPGEPKTVPNEQGRMWLLCLKNRLGPTFELEVTWQGAHQRIADLGATIGAPRKTAPALTTGQLAAMGALAQLRTRWDAHVDAAAIAAARGEEPPAPPVQRTALGQLAARWALPAAPTTDDHNRPARMRDLF